MSNILSQFCTLLTTEQTASSPTHDFTSNTTIGLAVASTPLEDTVVSPIVLQRGRGGWQKRKQVSPIKLLNNYGQWVISSEPPLKKVESFIFMS